MKNKPWYVWLSVFSLFVLLAVSMFQYFPLFNKRAKGWDVWGSLCGNMILTWFALFLLPSAIITVLIPLVMTALKLGYNMAGTHLILICMYFLGVNAACRHVEWREKHKDRHGV